MRFLIGFCFIALTVVAVFRAGEDDLSWLPTEEDFRIAAQDAHFAIAGIEMFAPLIALDHHGAGHGIDDSQAERQGRTERRARFRAQSDDPSDPVLLDRAILTFAVYGTYLETSRAQVVCDTLKRDWAKGMCDDPWSPVRQSLPPNRMILLNMQEIAQQAGWKTIGGESLWDQVAEMPLAPERTDVVCDDDGRFCTAATRLEGDLIAIWSVWDSEAETATHQAAREGKAVRAFYRFGLRMPEDYPALLQATCPLRRPGTNTHPNRPSPCG